MTDTVIKDDALFEALLPDPTEWTPEEEDDDWDDYVCSCWMDFEDDEDDEL